MGFKAPPGSNVLLITVDTLRADHLECYGYERIKTPNINRLAQEGILFRNAFCHTPLTLPSHWSILTGTYPPFHGVRDNAYFELPGNNATLAEMLASQGYATAAFVGSFVLDRRFGLGRGFQYYFDDFVPSKYEDASGADIQRRADAVVDEFLRWMDNHAEMRNFAWVHLYDPHDPYDPPPPYKSEYADSPYDGEIAFVDEQIGRISAFLEKANLLANTTIILTADHGESLGEHWEPTHGFFVYDSVLHVPLIIKPAGWVDKGVEVDSLVRSVDILPTVLELLGLPQKAQTQGRGLIGLVEGRDSEERASYSETHYPKYHFGWSELMALRTKKFKYIEAPRPELYDVAKDPAESTNVYADSKAAGAEMARQLRELVAQISARQVPVKESQVGDIEALKKLRSLGYLSRSTKPVEPSNGAAELADPKDKIDLYVGTQQALVASNEGRGQEAIRLLREILQKDSALPAARLALALEYQKRGDHQAAAKEFERMLRVDPDHPLATFNRALSLAHLERLDDALLGFQRAVELDPTYSKAYTQLGIVYQRQNRWADAQEQYRRALAIDPNDFTALNNRAVIHSRLGRLEDALRDAQASVKITPDRADGYNTLGSVYYLRKQYEQALHAYEKALSIDPSQIQTYLNLGLTYSRQDRPEKAIQAYETAAKVNPQNGQVHYYLAQAYAATGKTQEAEQAFRVYERLGGNRDRSASKQAH